MITGLFQQSIWFAVFGGMTMILGAIYMLYAYQRVMLGEIRPEFLKIRDLSSSDYLFLIPLIAVILGLGVYPQPIFNLVEASVNAMQNLLTTVAVALPIVH